MAWGPTLSTARRRHYHTDKTERSTNLNLPLMTASLEPEIKLKRLNNLGIPVRGRGVRSEGMRPPAPGSGLTFALPMA